MQDWFIRLAQRYDWPVLTLEMRRAKRSERSFVQMLWVAIGLTVIGLFIAFNRYCTVQNLYDLSDIRFLLGLFAGILRFVYTLFVVPAYASRTIAAEREMQRFENLAMTRLTSGEIIVQKAVMPMLYALALAVVMLPLDLFGWSVGEFSPLSFAGPLYMIVQTAVYTGIGILCSCMCARARTASAATYSIILIAPMVFGMLWSMFAFPVIMRSSGPMPFGPDGVLAMLFTGFGGLISWSVVAVLCLFFAVKKLDALRHGA